MSTYKSIVPTTNSSATVWSSLKKALRSEAREEVLNLPNGGRAVYYPSGSLSNEAGFRNMNAQEYAFISPSGSLVKVTNISAFCKDVFGVTETGRAKYASSFSDMILGKRKLDNVMGWKVYQEELEAA